MEIWTEKYRPKKFSDIRGQDQAIYKLKNFIERFPQKKRAAILHGPPGSGKTSMAHALASQLNYEIFELNASDLRNKKKLKEVLKPAMEQRSLVKSDKMILVDEANGITGTDRGGVAELARLVSDSKYPVIITVNDPWMRKLSPIRKKSEMIELKDVSFRDIKSVLIDILKSEGNFIQNEVLTKIASNSKGDLRAAINDLQAASQLEDPAGILFDDRNREQSIFNALQILLQEKPSKDMLRIFDSVDMPLDEIILWVEKNVPYEYRRGELNRAFDLISKTDIFKRRIYKRQYWRFLVYENAFLSYGIAASKKGDKSGFTRYKKPTRILKMWMNNQKTVKKKSISEKYSHYAHISFKKAMREFPIIRQVIRSNGKISKELKLTDEEIKYLQNFN